MQSHIRPTRYAAAVLLLPLTTIAINLPYNPTRIHLSSQPDGRQHAYILQPGSDSTVSAQLSALDLTQSIDPGNPSFKSLGFSLPFLSSGRSSACTSFVDQSGNITVLTGDCSKGADGASLWRLRPDTEAKNGGSWTQDKVISKDLRGQDAVTGANYLNAAIGFSELVEGNATDTSLYAFGGMCPSSGASDSTWSTNAQYSNTMVTYSPQQDTAEDDDYKIALVTSKGPPIAEAGMSMTPLSPTYSNTSGVQTQQQDFVVLGGHTQNAFINMSQVALFSLPQAVWSFLPVQQPAGAASSSDANFVTPRSGHTAVLAEDGRSMIIYGGWVGDVNTPASPQIAVLQLGSGYGGQGAWRWTTVPTPTGTFSGGAGIYGHGAAMLPGNVMMVVGGYSISSPSRKLMRRDGPVQNTRTFLYNVTSNSWVSSYSAPPESQDPQSGDGEQSGLSSPSKRAGVGVGVTFGVAALVGVGLFYVWHSKRSKRRRIDRDSTAITLVSEKPSWDEGWNTHTLHHGRHDMDYSYDPGSPEREAFPWLPEYGQEGWKSYQAKSREVDSTGAFLNIPSPTRGLRRASGGRNYQYQATPMEEPRSSMMISGIHPIVETDEEGYASNNSSRPGSRPGTADAQRRLLAAHEIFEGASRGLKQAGSRTEDPFKDPEPNPLGSHPVSPEPENGTPSAGFRVGQPPAFALAQQGSEREKSQISVQDWASARETQDSRSSAGRSSPTKSSATDDRTLSSLSEMSSRSYASARSVARTTSTRSQALFGLSGAPRISPQPSPTEDRTFSFTPSTYTRSNSGRRSPNNNGGGLARNRSVTSPSRTTFPTSHHRPQLSFDQLRSEGEALLGSNPNNSNTGPSTDLQSQIKKRSPGPRPASSLYSRDGSGTDLETDRGLPDLEPTSPTRKRLNWVGSIRKALGTYAGLDRSASGSVATSNGPSMLDSGVAAGGMYSDRSGSPSPTRSGGGLGSRRQPPRRTASDSSAFLVLKRGKDDWDVEGDGGRGSAWEPYRDEPDGGDWGEGSGPEIPKKSSKRGLSVNKQHPRVGKRKNVAFRDLEDGEGAEEGGIVAGADGGELLDGAGVDNGKAGRTSEDEDWDIEKAAEKRDVQVMFTVPKARLRVVNADPERASMRSVSEGSKKSVKSPPIGTEEGKLVEDEVVGK